MFVHHISYQYENGDVEEFVGSGLTPSSARQNSVFCAQAAVTSIRGEAFTLARISDVTTPSEHSQRNESFASKMYLAALF